MTASTPAGRAAAIYHCPFCADEDLRPAEGSADAWTCRNARQFVFQDEQDVILRECVCLKVE